MKSYICPTDLYPKICLWLLLIENIGDWNTPSNFSDGLTRGPKMTHLGIFSNISSFHIDLIMWSEAFCGEMNKYKFLWKTNLS